MSKKETIEASSKSHLHEAVKAEASKFQECYSWLEEAMPSTFFAEVHKDNISLITHALVGFDLQDYFSTINIHHTTVVMCLDSPDADLHVLKNMSSYEI